MVISPNDFSLWARLTGNKYPSTPAERAKKGPEVQRFIQNLGKEGMLGGKQEEEQKKKKSLPEKLATGALIAGGVAAGVAAARDPRVQNIARRAEATARDKVGDFLRNISGPRVVDKDVVDASYDVTPNPREQQSNVSLTQKSLPEGPSLIQRIEQKRAEMVDSFKPAVTGETFQTSGAISRDNIYEDIGDAKLRARRTFGPTIDALKEINPGRKDLGRMGSQMLRQAEQDRDFDIAYIDARNKGLDDTNAVRLARDVAGFENADAITGVRKSIGKPTEYRELLGTLKTESPIKPRVDDLLNLVKTGPQIILPEKAQNRADGSSAIVLAGGGNNTNVIPTMGATIGGPSLTDQLATKMAVDNVLDDARQVVQGQPGTQVSQNRITRTILPRSGPATGETQQEFINREFPVSAAEAGDTTPELSGTTIDPNRFPGGTMKQRIADLKTANYQALLSGNTTAGMQQAVNATGRKISNGLIYKNNPRLAARDADIITSAQLSGKDFKGEEIYFGPLETKLKQNLKLGTQFPEVLQDPTRENVIFQGELRDRTDFEKPVATTASQQRYDAKVQKQLDYRETEIGDAASDFETTAGRIEKLQNKIVESGNNVKSIIAGLPDRTDLTPTQKAVTKTELEGTLRRMRSQYSGLNETLDRSRDFFNKRATGIMKSTQDIIDNIPVEKTVKSQTGELYELRETKDPDTGKVRQNIVPAFSRIEDNTTGSSRGSQLRDPGVGQEYLGMLGKIVGEKDKETGRMIYKTSDDPVVDKKGKPVLMFTEERVRGDKPMANLSGRSVEAQIQDVYSPKYNYDRPTIKQKVAEIQERFKRQQATRMAGGLTIEDIQDL